MKVFVTLLLFALITVAIVKAQAPARSRPNGGNSKIQRSSVKTASRNPSRNIVSSKHNNRGKVGGGSRPTNTNHQRVNKSKAPTGIQVSKGKPAIKPVVRKPVSTGQPKIEVTRNNISGKPGNPKVHQPKVNKPETIKNDKSNGNVKSEIKNVDNKMKPMTLPTKETDKKNNQRVPVNAVNNQQAGNKPEDMKNAKGNVNVKNDVQMDNGKPIVDVKFRKEIYSNKDAGVSLKGQATLQESVKPKVSLGIDGTKKGDNANAGLKIDDGKLAITGEFEKRIYSSKDASISLKGDAVLQKGEKPKLSLGIDGTKKGDNANAGLKIDDGKLAITGEFEKGIYSSKDASVSLKGDAVLQKGGKPKLSLGIEGTKDGHSIDAKVKVIDGKPALGIESEHQIYKKNGLDWSLKTGVDHQINGETKGIIELEGKF